MEWTIALSLSLLLFAACAFCSRDIRNSVENSLESIRLHQEAAAFYHYLEREMRGASLVAIGPNRLLFTRNDDWFEYRKTGDIIVRERDGMGYVIVCYYVQDFSIHSARGGALARLSLKGNRSEIVTESIVELPVRVARED